MTLRASRSRELLNPNLSVGGRAELRCELAKEFEDQGEYEQARKVLSGYWRRIGERPKIANLEPNTAGEVLLRVGVVTGLIGSQNQITDAQEHAKDLISESLTVFTSRRYKKKIAEAQTELALCYWRTGEYNNAFDLLSLALAQLATDSELKAKAVLRLAIVERTSLHCEEALRILTNNAALFAKIHNQTLKGGYHDALGNVLKDLWKSERRTEYVDRALIEYSAASYHFEQAGHRRYLASDENNLGLLYYKINLCEEAHKHLDRARRILVILKDAVTIAQVDETRACVFLRQGHIAEAERVACSSVRRLNQSDSPVILVEALITHGKALARLERYSAALFAFRRAINLAQHTGSIKWAAEAALAAFQEIGEHLTVSEGGPLSSGRGMSEEKRAFEHEAIKLALENAKGSVTHAALSLNVSYPSLNYMLRTRHKDLLKLRTPVRRRPRKE